MVHRQLGGGYLLMAIITDPPGELPLPPLGPAKLPGLFFLLSELLRRYGYYERWFLSRLHWSSIRSPGCGGAAAGACHARPGPGPGGPDPETSSARPPIRGGRRLKSPFVKGDFRMFIERLFLCRRRLDGDIEGVGASFYEQKQGFAFFHLLGSLFPVASVLNLLPFTSLIISPGRSLASAAGSPGRARLSQPRLLFHRHRISGPAQG